MTSEQRLTNIDSRLERLVTANEQQGQNIEVLVSGMGALIESMTELKAITQNQEQCIERLAQTAERQERSIERQGQQIEQLAQTVQRQEYRIERLAQTAERQERNIEGLVGIVERLIEQRGTS